MPQPWAACAKSAAQKFSPTSTTGLETHAKAILIQPVFRVKSDVVFRKLGVRNRTQAVIAIQQMEIDPSDQSLSGS